MLTVLNHFTCMNGTFTSTVDAYLGLSKYTDVNLVTIADTLVSGEFAMCMSKNIPRLDVMQSVTRKRQFETDVVVVSSTLVHNILTMKLEPIKVDCRRVVVMDSLADYTAHISGQREDMDSLLLKMFPNADILYLCNNWTKNFHGFDYEIYYHKCITERLCHFAKNDGTGEFKRDREVGYSLGNNAFYSRSFTYERRDRGAVGYHDNIGKLMFEFASLGRPVEYSPSHFREDGVADYMRYLDLDPEKGQSLAFDRVLLEFTENDLLLEVTK